MSRECSRCTVTPKYNIENCRLFIGIGSDHLFDKISMLLKKLGIKFTEYKRHFTADIQSLEGFVESMENTQALSSVEMSDIYLLPVDPGQVPDYGQFTDSRSLYYWTTLYENKNIVDAIEYGRIKTLFQPILRASNLEPFAHEALSRAFTHCGKPIPTEDLFKVSKKLDMLYNLDRQCRLASIKNAASFDRFKGKLFINFIPTVIYDPNVCLQTTHKVAKKTSLRPKDIVFEVVESEFVEDYKHLTKILEFYRQKGYQTALDDVGSGFSTYSRYEVLKTNYIKIDRSVIENIHESKASQVYLQHALDLKSKTGVKIIAEGIETPEEYAYIKNTDVDFVQGYHFARPKEEPLL